MVLREGKVVSIKLIDFKQFLFRMSFGPAWAGRTAYMVVAHNYVTRRKGLEVLRQQIINLWVRGQRLVLCEALQVHATQKADPGVGGRRDPHQEY